VEVSVENGNVNTPPIAAIAGEATIPAAAGEPVTLDATPSHDAEGAIVSYVWDFGDGASGVGAAVTHPYLSAGTYEATVTVADDGGLTSAATVTVVITGDIEIEVLVDSFENGEWNGLWTEDPQDAWSITTNRATDGVAAAMIGPAASAATLTSGSLETHGATTASVTLAWYLRERAATGDRLALEYSTDGGGTWTPAAALESGVDALGVWHEVAVVVPCAPVLQIRLSATIQGNRIFGLVDNVLVTVGGAVEEISADPSAEIGATEEDTRMRPR
jgi:hypothetical protein